MISEALTRRSLLKLSSYAVAANAVLAEAFSIDPSGVRPIHLNLNENAFGPSAKVAPAITREMARINRYANEVLAQTFKDQIAAYERVGVDQIVLGEVLGPLGFYLATKGGPGGEFLYSTPGYLALVDAASHAGGVGVAVPLNAQDENDLPALRAKVSAKTRAVYLINPHNPTGTVSDDAAFKRFLREVSGLAPVIVDEAYLEYAPDFQARSAVSLVREGANVLVFRTFDKIHGLAGLPIGYTLAPKELAEALRKGGLGEAESLGRLNLVAAGAALSDEGHVLRVRDAVAKERAKWLLVLDELRLQHTATQADFVFFNAGRPEPEIARRFHEEGIEIARSFAPYTQWARITIGLPDENERAQRVLRRVLQKG